MDIAKKVIEIFENDKDDIKVENDDMNYRRWFEETEDHEYGNKPIFGTLNTMVYSYEDGDLHMNHILTSNNIDNTIYNGPKSIVDVYFQEILLDKTGKYFLITKRRVKWFLLAQVHLYNCTLTYRKLHEPQIITLLLQKLAELSTKLESSISDISERKCSINCSHNNNKECLEFLKIKNFENYCGSIREPCDLGLRNWGEYNINCMNDDLAEDFVNYAYNGKNKVCKIFQKTSEIYTISKQKKWYFLDNGWNNEYFVGNLVSKFLLRIIVYDYFILNTISETFSSHYDSSPMSSFNEVIEDYLISQREVVEKTIGKKKTEKLERIRLRLQGNTNVYNDSCIQLSIFEVYRIFHVY